MKRIANCIWKYFCKLVSGIGKMARALKEALTLGDAPRNLGLTRQTATTVASAVVPIVLPQQIIELLGSTAQGAVVSVSSWLSHHGVSAAGWIAFKLGLASAAAIGSAIATCGVCILLLCGIRFLQRLDKRFSIFSGFAETWRAVMDWIRSIGESSFGSAFEFAS